MSQYRDFVANFPARCQDVLRLASGRAEAQDRVVTLLLLVASASLVMPFERLRGGMRTEHPSFDRTSHPHAARALETLLNKKFLSSALWSSGAESWEWSHLEAQRGGAEAWDELRSAAPLTATFSVGQLFAVIRNGLAHGSVFTTGDPISSLVFVSERRKDQVVLGHQYVRCSPADFRRFLNQWFAFLQENEIGQSDVDRSLSAA